MTPRAEYAQLVLCSKNLGGGVLLLLLYFALFLVSAGILLCTVFIITFRTWHIAIDRMTARISAGKGKVFNVT